MRAYSITRRVVGLVLAMELVSAVIVTGAAFFYERHAYFRSFDNVLMGRAQSVMGAVEEADDPGNNVMLDTADLRLPKEDVYVVREGARELGRYGEFQGPVPAPAEEQVTQVVMGGQTYHAVLLEGVRVVDPNGLRVKHLVTVVYASPTRRVWRAVIASVRMFALANLALLLMTGLMVPWLVRRSMRPVLALAEDAQQVTAQSWGFAPGEEVRAVAELQPLVQALERVLLRLERSFAQQRQFVSDGAHELKTAVAVVKSSVQLLEMRARTAEEYRLGLARCVADCERMEELAQKMLLLARVEEGPARAVGTAVEMVECSRSVVAEMAGVATIRGVGVEVVAGETVWAGVSEEMWRSVLGNLVLNAVQHSPEGGVVRVSLQTREDWAECTVEDEGAGIPADVAEHVFDRFYRGDPSRSRQTGGTGLGLAISKAIVERAGGRIAVERADGGGARMRVRLPRAAAAGAAVAAPGQGARAIPEGGERVADGPIAAGAFDHR